VTALLDTNVVVRHLTGDPPAQARRATAFLATHQDLLATDVMLAELVFVLGSSYGQPRDEIAALVRDLLALPSVTTIDLDVVLRTLELYETTAIHFVDAYLAAAAELTGIRVVVSFDQGLDRVGSIRRIEP
jgi:predicted nucleic acid-binding protein